MRIRNVQSYMFRCAVSLIMSLVMAICTSSNLYCANWKIFFISPDQNNSREGSLYYIDTDSIEKNNINIKFFTKTIYSKSAAINMRADLKTNVIPESSIQSWVANCSTKVLGLTAIVVYDSSGNAIYSHRLSQDNFERVIPDSIGDVTMSHVCKYYNKK